MTQSTSPLDFAPPSFQPPHNINLVSVDDSKITRVNVYAGRAEIMRIFKFPVHTGQNQVNISGLPRVLDRESFRVEGQGSATIHDVSLSSTARPLESKSSPELAELEAKKEHLQRTFRRVKKSMEALEKYLDTLTVEHVEVGQAGKVVADYNETAEGLDMKTLGLQKELKLVDEEIFAEKKKLVQSTEATKLSMKAEIGIFAHQHGEVTIRLIYAVNSASWAAGYDIRVNMEKLDTPIKVTYKGTITQSTGENWDNVSLILETSKPTFGTHIPSLQPWALSSSNPVTETITSFVSRGTARSGTKNSLESLNRSVTALENRTTTISSQGNVNATYAISGIITIPSDGVAHNVTIAELDLNAEMSWVSVPKRDSRTHVNARIVNISEYTLLPGRASVYIDGSFVSRSEIPMVNPEENFDCSIGIDPSVRITYHPCIKKGSRSGYFAKTNSQSYLQKITVFNAKVIPLQNLKIIDQVPISEDSTINVKLVSPALTIPVGFPATKAKSEITKQVPFPLQVAEGVEAQWEMVEETEDVDSIGKDGKFSWNCSIAAQSKISLQLHWEVTAPTETTVYGL
ncbi:hypothetical protein BDQ12DRAFT_745564 [Crucibulum laeve]|uniref:Mucoidy inhibitor A n=1 Tax=Crucibulum laeve TaxID=68775 RepID=A0A5C3M173_9AGAR|nr:hypothetical protein BDQ12DRAFT_745564 [Crucibulum laeve]